MESFTLYYGGQHWEIADTAKNRDILKSAARGHDSFLVFALATGGSLAILAGPGIPLAVTHKAPLTARSLGGQVSNGAYD